MLFCPNENDPFAKLVARLCLGPEGAGERDWAILAGLMLIGDERVTPITKEVWVQLLPPARIAAVKCELNEVFRAQVLIHLDLLERETDERVYGSLAVALGNCAKQATKFGILDIERVLPIWKSLDQANPYPTAFASPGVYSEFESRSDCLAGDPKVMLLVRLLSSRHLP